MEDVDPPVGDDEADASELDAESGGATVTSLDGLEDDVEIDTEEVSPGARFAFNEDPYNFDDLQLDLALDLLRKVAATGHSAGESLRRLASERVTEDDQAPLIRELWLALNYRLRVHLQGEDPGCDLVPASAFGGSSWPPQPHDVTDSVRSLWREVAKGDDLPNVLKAHFNDLLVVAKESSPHLHAEAAAVAYLDAATALDERVLESTEALVRAWELTRRFKLGGVEVRTVDEMLTFVSAGLDDGPGHPGVVLPALSACCAALHASRAELFDPAQVVRLDELLERALSMYGRSDLTSEVARHMRQRASGADAVDVINRAEVQARIDEAATARSAAVKQHFLNAAAQLAASLGLEDMRQSAIRDMQRISPDDLGLQRISVKGAMPRDVIETYLEQFTRSPNWRDGLRTFLSSGPPTGDLEQLRSTSENLSQVSVLRRLFSTVVLGPDGLPVVAAHSEADKDEHDLATVAAQQASTYGRLMAEGLNRVRDRHGVPDRASLTLLLSGDGCGDPVLSERLAVAFEMFWDEDYSSSVHIAAPLAEAAARALLRFLDEAVYRTQKAHVRGGYVGLHSLIEALEALDLDPSWAYYLKWLLISPYGPNLRNSIAHGFGGGADPVHAALVLRAVGMLVLLVPLPDRVGSNSQSAEDFQAAIMSLLRTPVSSPTPWPRRSVSALLRSRIERPFRSLLQKFGSWRRRARNT